MSILGEKWIETQIKVFSRWCNKHVKSRGLEITDCTKDFEDGVKLCTLLEVVGKEPIPQKWHKNPKIRVQKLENAAFALDYITKVKGVKLVGIGSDNIVDMDKKLTLGMIWSVINKFVIEDISVEEATARDALLIWCQKNTAGYDGVKVTNFTTSWNTGLAFCALINHFRPNVLDYNSLDKSNHPECCQKAFDACKEIGLTVYLDVEDVADTTPDEKSIVTQVSEFFHLFAADTKTEAMAKKIARTVSIQKQIAEIQHGYEGEAKEALDAMEKQSQKIADDSFEKDVTGLKGKLVDVIKYGKEGRPEVFDLKGKAQRSYTALQLKCKQHQRPIPAIDEQLTPENLDKRFDQLDEQATERRKGLLGELNGKVQAYLEGARAIQNDLSALEEQVKSVDGDNEAKRNSITEIIAKIEAKKEDVDALDAPYNELEAAEMHLEISETPSFIGSLYTTALQHAQTVHNEVEAAIAADHGLEITQEEINSYAETFALFDKQNNKLLEYYELRACLLTLDDDITDDEAKEICHKYNNGENFLKFEDYVRFMKERHSKAENAETTLEAFKAIAANNPVVTDEQLSRYFSAEDADYLRSVLTQVDGGYNFEDWVNGLYA